MPERKVLSLSNLDLHVVKTHPPGLVISVEGEVGSPGWTDFSIALYEYVRPPADGIYEGDMIGAPPAGPAPGKVAPFTFSDTWIGFPEEHLKGLRIYAESNDLTSSLER